jgi:hypothetical protein
VSRRVVGVHVDGDQRAGDEELVVSHVRQDVADGQAELLDGEVAGVIEGHEGPAVLHEAP